MAEAEYWQDEGYIRIEKAAYEPDGGQLIVTFRNGDEARLSAWRVLRPENRDPRWDNLEVVEQYHISVPVQPGTGDAGSDVHDVPGFTLRALTDPVFAAYLARQAEESARLIGRRLRELRKARGLTEAELAARVGVAQQHISRLEQGRHTPSFPTVEKILAAMGYTRADLTLSPAPAIEDEAVGVASATRDRG